jgi:hypothetical protein
MLKHIGTRIMVLEVEDGIQIQVGIDGVETLTRETDMDTGIMQA